MRAGLGPGADTRVLSCRRPAWTAPRCRREGGRMGPRFRSSARQKGGRGCSMVLHLRGQGHDATGRAVQGPVRAGRPVPLGRHRMKGNRVARGTCAGRCWSAAPGGPGEGEARERPGGEGAGLPRPRRGPGVRAGQRCPRTVLGPTSVRARRELLPTWRNLGCRDPAERSWEVWGWRGGRGFWVWIEWEGAGISPLFQSLRRPLGAWIVPFSPLKVVLTS